MWNHFLFNRGNIYSNSEEPFLCSIKPNSDNLFPDLNLKDHYGNSALHFAVEASQVESIEFLLDAGADSSVLNDKNMAALHMAADGGYLKSLEVTVSGLK